MELQPGHWDLQKSLGIIYCRVTNHHETQWLQTTRIFFFSSLFWFLVDKNWGRGGLAWLFCLRTSHEASPAGLTGCLSWDQKVQTQELSVVSSSPQCLPLKPPQGLQRARFHLPKGNTAMGVGGAQKIGSWCPRLISSPFQVEWRKHCQGRVLEEGLKQLQACGWDKMFYC